DPDASGRRRPRTYGNHIVLAIRNQLPDLFDHLQNQLIRPGPEADHNGLRIFSQQPEYESLEPPHLWLKLEITGVGAVGNRVPTEALLDSPPRSLRHGLPARGIGEQIPDRGGAPRGCGATRPTPPTPHPPPGAAGGGRAAAPPPPHPPHLFVVGPSRDGERDRHYPGFGIQRAQILHEPMHVNPRIEIARR